MLLWHIDCFELKATEKECTGGLLPLSLSAQKKGVLSLTE